MKTKLYLSLVALALFVFPSCRNSPTQIGEQQFIAFPNMTGNMWRYFHFDSLAQKSDTLLVTIVGDTVLPFDQTAKIWKFSYPKRTDTAYVTVSDDTVRLVSSSHDYRIVFPLRVGNAWTGNYWFNDTLRVVDYGPITVTAGSFSNAYQIVESWRGFNDFGSIARWFVPGVGIVRIYHRGASFGMANETYELISYDIVQ